MNIVVVGHVDHGKSTLVGRLLADTQAIDPAKIEKVRGICEQQGKRFEYAFLLDALEAEQEQGITIDSARCFFPSEHRDYILIDAPGHIEFLKNMISGAARAEAAVLLIDAHEGVRENSRRHGYMLSLLGIRQVVVAVNKMDRVDYSREVFERIEAEYRDFLAQIEVEPAAFIPVSALEGDNVVRPGGAMSWYEGKPILAAIEKAAPAEAQPLRMPVQDVYRFNRAGDHRRIVAGRVVAGRVKVGDEVVFLPSGKRTRIASIEGFAMPEQAAAAAGRSTGVTMEEHIYVARGDVMAHVDAPPRVSNRLRTNLVWLGRKPLRQGRTYKLKMCTYSGLCEVERIEQVIDASALEGAGHHDRVERHEVAEVVLRLRKPLACDLSHEAEETSRFVLVDGYDMAGGGIVRAVLEADEDDAGMRWTMEVGAIDRPLRETKHGHRAALVVVHDDLDRNGSALAAALEESLWSGGHEVYRVNFQANDLLRPAPGELALRSISFGLVAGLLNAGQLVVATVPWMEDLPKGSALRMPGFEAVPAVQIRFGAGEDQEAEWVLAPGDEPRAHHDVAKAKLKALL